MTPAGLVLPSSHNMLPRPSARLLPFLVLDWLVPPCGTKPAEDELCRAGAKQPAEDGSKRQQALQAAGAVSSRLMLWDDSRILIDLRVCEAYWRARARAAGCDVPSLICQQLGAAAGKPAASRGGQFRLAMAAHPWQAVLLAERMRQRRLQGLISLDSPFGKNLYRDVSWRAWWSCVGTLYAHFRAGGRLRQHDDKNVARQFRQQRAHMQRAMQRLGIQTPWQMAEVSPQAIKRRFGAFMHDVWSWSFALGDGARHLAQSWCDDFPWKSVVAREVPRVTRHLDVPVGQWDELEAFLREDFDRLCAHAGWHAAERVVSLEWRLVSPDSTSISIPICFRHPHPLHSERGVHKTALLQASHSFQRQQFASERAPEQRRTLVDATAGVVYETPLVRAIESWSLILRERITLAPTVKDLFGENVATGASAPMRILALENKLQVPLVSYALRDDWVPEDSYVPCSDEATRADEQPLACEPAAMALARLRPLFLQKTPTLLDERQPAGGWQFCERVMAKWWQTGKSASWQRDYYRFIDADERMRWVFKDALGRWFVQGIYA